MAFAIKAEVVDRRARAFAIIARQTPRVSVTIRRTALAKRTLGRRDLKHLTDWKGGRPGTELNFKFYRQATNKIVGISDKAASFLSRCF